MAASTRSAAERALLAAMLLFLLWNSLYYAPFVVDDAFISMRYASNLVEGNGLVFNPGERVEGYSNFLWVLASAALMSCGLPVLTGLKVLGVLAGLATGLSTFLLGRILFQERPADSWGALLAAGLVCTNTNLAVWTEGGLETALFAALIVGMCLRYEVERRSHRVLPVSALLFALLWLTRPEAPLYGLYFLARRLWDREGVDRRDRVWLATLAAVVVPYEAWGLAYYGALFPHTHAAKVGPTLDRGFDRFQLFAFFFRQGWAFPTLCAIGLLGCLRRLRAVPIAAWAPVISGAAFALYAWFDWMPRFRFMVPFLPALSLLVAHGVLQLCALIRDRGPFLRYLGGLVLALLLVGYGSHQMFAPYYRQVQREAYQLPAGARGAWFMDVPRNIGHRIWPIERFARMILELAPEGETVAIPDVGLPGFLGMNPIWDLRGLVTPAATRFSADDPGSRREVLDDLFARRPVLMLVPLDNRFEHFDRAIREDPRATAYERSVLMNPKAVLYLRLDRPPSALERRLRAAAERFPEYAAASGGSN